MPMLQRFIILMAPCFLRLSITLLLHLRLTLSFVKTILDVGKLAGFKFIITL